MPSVQFKMAVAEVKELIKEGKPLGGPKKPIMDNTKGKGSSQPGDAQGRVGEG